MDREIAGSQLNIQEAQFITAGNSANEAIPDPEKDSKNKPCQYRDFPYSLNPHAAPTSTEPTGAGGQRQTTKGKLPMHIEITITIKEDEHYSTKKLAEAHLEIKAPSISADAINHLISGLISDAIDDAEKALATMEKPEAISEERPSAPGINADTF